VLDHLTADPKEIPAQEINASFLFMIGHSRGGGLVVLKTAEDERITGLSTWAAISDIDQRWSQEVMEAWQKTGVQYILNGRTGQQMPLYYQLAENFMANRARLNILKAAEKIQAPWLIIHGEQDETLPVQMAHELHACNPFAELFLIPEGDHSFGGRHPFEDSELPAFTQAAAQKTITFFRQAIERA
jgi:uncharacterized protein